ncbi:hypothetical protein M5W70_06325 [Paenibacillus larvae]|nr:hypothetical protein [Paenibacillus larvae]MCY9688335.1 hypothetical protein [Paenibacillus larvae]MDV3485119.1 hypothetical protein [Paenibacillus larvae]
MSIVDIDLSNTTIDVRLQVEEFGRKFDKTHKFVMVCEDGQVLLGKES